MAQTISSAQTTTRTAKLHDAGTLLRKASDVGAFELIFHIVSEKWSVRFVDLMTDSETSFFANTPEDALVAAILHATDPDWLNDTPIA